MHGLIAGALAALALPPLQWNALGLVWLCPWLIGLNAPLRLRLLRTLPIAIVPVAHSVSPGALTHPLAAAALLAAVLGPLLIAAVLAADRQGATSAPRLIASLAMVSVFFAALRHHGSPMSLALFPAPAPWTLQGVNRLGLLLTDLLLATLQVLLVWLYWHARQTPRQIAGPALGVLLVLASGLGLQWHGQVRGDVARTDSWQVAIVQARLTPHERDRLGADGVLERVLARQSQWHALARRLGVDWLVWPESSTPGYPPPQGPDAPADGLGTVRHLYTYEGPGQLRSLALLESADGQRQMTEKAHPLVFAEPYLAPVPNAPLTGTIDNVTAGVLICSEVLREAAVDQALSEGADILLNPSASTFSAGPVAALVQRDAAHLQAARVNVPLIMAGNGGPSGLLLPSGARAGAMAPGMTGLRVVDVPRRRAGASGQVAWQVVYRGKHLPYRRGA